MTQWSLRRIFNFQFSQFKNHKNVLQVVKKGEYDIAKHCLTFLLHNYPFLMISFMLDKKEESEMKLINWAGFSSSGHCFGSIKAFL